MTLAHLDWWSLRQMLRAWGRHADAAPVFERVDGMLLDGGDFRASDSIGLDGAPSMVFCDAMPPYSRDIDRPSMRHG